MRSATEVEYFHSYMVGTGDNAVQVHHGPEKVAKSLRAFQEMSLSPSAARSASPAFGETALRTLAGDINQSKDAAVIFATDPNPVVRQKALDLLAEAEKRTGVSTNAVTGFHEKTGTTVLVFRDPATATRADVFEELRHLDWARVGNWTQDLPGVFTAFELRREQRVRFNFQANCREVKENLP